ncbi:hypothetical protein [Dethiothermospora halolimnae]|uniref:hypothetical protein n=1 Tax=Dethiothermospora halolimnae TaxID=3114390 RepID=UPI003CCBF096
MGKETSITSLIGLALPLMMLLNNKNEKGDGIKLNLDLNDDFERKKALVSNIKGYFNENGQETLSKVEDIIDIFNKVKRIKESKYKNEVKSTNNLPAIDKGERILAEMIDYMDDDRKKVAENIIDTKKRIDETKHNITTYKESNEKIDIKKIDSIIDLIKCFDPVLDDKHKKKVKKIEKIMEVMKMSEDEF